MRFAFAVCFSVSLLSGCATQGINTSSYQRGETSTSKNEKTVSRSQPAVWDELVKELAKSFYVINNIERESRIINVSFNSNTPTDYVNCGRSQRAYRQGETVERFDYAFAEKSHFKFAASRQEHPAFANYAIIQREPSLEGRSNIYVAPHPSDSAKTVVSVNTRYVLTVRVRGDAFAEHITGNVHPRGPVPEQVNSYIFSTNNPSTTESGGHSIVCVGRGRLESDILNMVRD